MDTCVICANKLADDSILCTHCGFLNKKALSTHYQNLMNRQTQIYQQTENEKVEVNSLVLEKSEQIQSLENNIKKVENTLSSLAEKLQQKKKFYEESIRELQEKEIILNELRLYEEYLSLHDTLFKKRDYSLSPKQILKVRVRNQKVRIDSNIENTVKPNLLLVLSRQKMHKTTTKAEYYLSFKDELVQTNPNTWIGSISNPLQLNGDYFGWFTNIHSSHQQQIKVEGPEFKLTFN
jgi:hypothetical protein